MNIKVIRVLVKQASAEVVKNAAIIRVAPRHITTATMSPKHILSPLQIMQRVRRNTPQ